MRTWMLRMTIAAALTLAGAAPAFAQATGQITGTVADSVTGEPLAGAQVIVPGTKLGAVVNDRGHYLVQGVPAGQTTVRVQRIGYAPAEQTVTVADGQTVTVDFHLQPRAVMLKEVVAVGYGTQRKEEVTSAVSSVNSEDFIQAPARDAASLISGKIAGLAVTTPTGDPRSGTEITLRGITTLEGSRSPLVLIDGVPGDLNTVPPRDIESISVLKDNSAAAIYGSRASNGVILITTKKYEGGKPTIRYDGYVSQQRIANSPDFLSASDYRRLIQDSVPFQDMGFNTNWQSQVLRQPVSSRHNVSISGGGENNFYNASLNYENTQGIFKRSDNKSLTGRISLGQIMYDGKLEADFDLLSRVHNYFGTPNGAPGYDYAWRQALIRNPTDRVFDSTGAYQERSGYFYVNPLGIIETENANTEDRDLRLHGTLKFRPVDNLNLSLMAGTERSEGQDGDATTFQNAATTQATGVNGTASRGASNSIDHILELTGTYNNALGRNHFTLLAGYSYQDFENDGFSANNYNFPTDLFGYNSLQQGAALSTGQAGMSSYKNSYKLIGFFGRLNYDWNNRFLLNGSLRYEGNSKFGANHKWGLFPAISAGWQIGNEGFMKGLGWVSQLKLRAGYGVTGIAPRDPYQSLTSYRYRSKFLYNGEWVAGLTPARNPNPDLRWERKSEINVGVDFALFNSRLSGSFDAYQSDNRDMLYNYSVPVPPYLFGSILANVGHMQNKGLEASLSYDVIKRPNLQWTTSANWSTNRNKLVSLSNDVYQTADFFYTGYTGEPVQTSTHRIDIGGPIGNFWGWKSVDIDTSGAWIVLDSAGNRISVRDAKDKDKRVLGNGLPKHYVAWNNTVRYKHFDLNVNMRGAFDFQILNFQRMFYENPTITQYNMLKSAFDKVYGKRTLNYDLAYVSYYIENGDYWKIDNVTLGYTFSPSMLGPVSRIVSGARIYLSGSNLLTLTGYKGMDPEVTTYGSSDPLSPGDDTRDTYPTTRVFTAGLSLSF